MNKIILFLIKLLISFSILYFIFKKLDFFKIIESLKNVNVYFLFVVLILIIISIILMSLKWNVFVRKFSNVSKKKLFFVYWAGNFMSLFNLGSVGSEVYKMISFKEKKKALTSSLIDKGYSFIWYIILFLPLILFYLLFGQLSYIIIIFSILIYFFLVLVFILIDGKIKNILIKFEFNKKLKKIIDFSKVSNKDLIKHSIISLIYIINLYLIYSIVMYSVGLPIKLEFLLFIPLLSILLTLPISIQGLGVREFVLVTYAKFYGFNLEFALVSALLIFVISLICNLIGIIPFLILKGKD